MKDIRFVTKSEITLFTYLSISETDVSLHYVEDSPSLVDVFVPLLHDLNPVQRVIRVKIYIEILNSHRNFRRLTNYFLIGGRPFLFYHTRLLSPSKKL